MAFVPVSPQTHAQVGFKPVTDFSFAAKLPLVPVVLPEVALMIQSHALCFAKGPEGITLYALLGAGEQGCAYVLPDGRWAAPYVPLNLRKGGFALLKAEGRDELIFCMDDEAHSVEADALALINEEGQLSDAAKTQLELVKQAMGTLQLTAQAAQALEKAGVLKPWEVLLKNGDHASKAGGLLCVDQEKLNTLSDEEYAKLKGAPMTLAYAQLFSMRNIQLLNLLISRKAEQEEEVDIEALFGDANDTLQF